MANGAANSILARFETIPHSLRTIAEWPPSMMSSCREVTRFCGQPIADELARRSYTAFMSSIHHHTLRWDGWLPSVIGLGAALAAGLSATGWLALPVFVLLLTVRAAVHLVRCPV